MKFLNLRLLLAWTLAVPVSYLALGFLENFYITAVEIVLIALLIQTLMGALVYHLVGRVQHPAKNRPFDFGLVSALFIVLAIFVTAMFGMAKQYPSLFDAEYFLLEGSQSVFFLAGCLGALPVLAWGINLAGEKGLQDAKPFRLIRDNLPGLLAAAFFFSVYLILVSIFNRPVFDVDDIFFDSDGLLWRLRFTTENWRDYYWRSVHPFVLLLIRPPVALISIFLKGDRLSAAFILVASSGAFCVFLAWYFVRKITGNTTYALLIASILGASTSHLAFGSLIETYIFLAAAAMFFTILLLKERPLFAYVLAGLPGIGITLTNFAQTVIAFLMVKRDFKRWVKYGLIVGLLTFPLTLINNFIYPDANPYFFDLSSLNAEADNTFVPTASRALAVARVMALHSVVAPDPLILQEEIPFLKVWIFKAEPLQVSEYDTLPGNVLAVFWLGLLILGGLLFLKNIRKEDHRFSLPFFWSCFSILPFTFATARMSSFIPPTGRTP